MTACASPAQLASALQKFNEIIDSARAASEDGEEESSGEEEEEWQQDEPQEFVERPDITVRVQVPASASQAVSVHAESEGDTDESEEVRGRWDRSCRGCCWAARGNHMVSSIIRSSIGSWLIVFGAWLRRLVWFASRAGFCAVHGAHRQHAHVA